MNPIALLINELLYRPIFNLLMVFLGMFGGNLGWAIIVLTLAIRLILVKQTGDTTKMQSQMGDLQPKMQAIQEKYQNDPQKLSEETMKLLKKDGAGPLKGCLSMLVQIPVFIGLYSVLINFSDSIKGGATSGILNFKALWGSIDLGFVDQLYSFLYPFFHNYLNFSNINTHFFGLDLLKSGSITLTILSALLIYVNMKMTMLIKPASTPAIPGANMPDMSKMMEFMNYFMVFMMGSLVWSMASGIGLYIVTTTLFSVAQFRYNNRLLVNAQIKLFFIKK